MSGDILAIFKAEFHVTKGNLLVWNLKVEESEISLEGVEFSVLPSGIHAVEKDVVYFTVQKGTETLQGLSVFRRLATTEQGQRGVRLASLGIVLTPGSKPWRHLERLESSFDISLRDTSYTEPTNLFEDYRSDCPRITNHDISSNSPSPINHLPHLLPIIGPFSSTLHKHILMRRRILIYCKPPVQVGCILAWICGFLGEPFTEMLGCITLSDIDRLVKLENGWVACTTDALFLEKPTYYDLLIDLTTLKPPNRTPRPTFHTTSNGKLVPLRWGWSDIKPWIELERILSLSSPTSEPSCCSPSPPLLSQQTNTVWPDLWIWRIYEDVCLVCAGLFLFGSSNNNNDDDILAQLDAEESGPEPPGGFYMRNVGNGIEGSKDQKKKKSKRRSGMGMMSTLLSNVGDISGTSPSAPSSPSPSPSSSPTIPQEESLQRTTTALLQTFHAQARFWESMLKEVVCSRLGSSIPSTSSSSDTILTITLLPRDLLALSLNPFSTFDVTFVEWLGGTNNLSVVVKRSWAGFVGLVA